MKVSIYAAGDQPWGGWGGLVTFERIDRVEWCKSDGLVTRLDRVGEPSGRVLVVNDAAVACVLLETEA